MDDARHTLLRTKSHAVRTALLQAAIDSRQTVDAIVVAGLGRASTDVAVRVAKEFAAKYPGAFSSLEAWPFDCAFCSASVKALTPCVHCSRREGCAACVTFAGCPRCVEAHATKARELKADLASLNVGTPRAAS